MKKLLLFVAIVFNLCGCLVVGQGKAQGYITAVESSVFWNKVYVKSDLQSSKEDVFLIRKSNKELYNELENLMTLHGRIEIKFLNHMVTLTMSDYVGGEVIDVKEIN